MSMTCRPKWSFLLMYVSRDTMRTDFPQVDGGQQDPRDWGVTKHISFNFEKIIIITTMVRR